MYVKYNNKLTFLTLYGVSSMIVMTLSSWKSSGEREGNPYTTVTDSSLGCMGNRDGSN